MAAVANIVIGVGVEYPAGWSEAERNTERRHREIMAELASADYRGEVLQADAGSFGPTDYEVWRDALTLAAATHAHPPLTGSDRERFIGLAEWFWDRLQQEVPVRTDADGERWYVPCGCDHHGDHLGCVGGCAETGCQHRIGEEFTAPTEHAADNHQHGPECRYS